MYLAALPDFFLRFRNKVLFFCLEGALESQILSGTLLNPQISAAVRLIAKKWAYMLVKCRGPVSCCWELCSSDIMSFLGRSPPSCIKAEKHLQKGIHCSLWPVVSSLTNFPGEQLLTPGKGAMPWTSSCKALMFFQVFGQLASVIMWRSSHELCSYICILY